MDILGFLKREFSFISGNYRILIISWMIMDLAMEMPVPNFQYYVQALGGTGMALGIIGAANFLAMAAVAFPGGYLADKYGRRWLITTMTFGLAFSYVFFALAPSWHFILIGTILQGLCLIYQPALFAMVQDSLPPERRGVGFSLVQMIHGTFNTPGPIIAGLLLLRFGLVDSMRIVYVIVIILYLTAAVWRLRLKETIKSGDPIRFSHFVSSYPQAIRECYINVWKVVPRSVLWLLSVQILFMFSNALINVINAIYARDVLGIPEELWWLTFIPLLVTMMIASFPVGKLIDRIGAKIPLTLGPLTLMSALLIFVNGNFYTVMVAMALLSLVFLLVMSSGMTLTAQLVEPENRGKVRGFLNFAGYIATGFGMLLGNFLYNQMPQLPFYLTIVLTVPMILIIVFRVHTYENMG
ncbi:MAG: MFS transporter [Candidatus Bathyarchaeia archaeon]|jgi:MFS family permease|nr:MFS transporter [Candidatus Bathyarchaeota archaeon A05DMB-4]MDH7594895.1 MFS transporter [Candidatus Bathyarchaeota archaeon]